jgi:hypothetical protein
MKTRYVISYRGSEAYVCSYDRNTGGVIYTPQIENAYKFDSLIEALLFQRKSSPTGFFQSGRRCVETSGDVIEGIFTNSTKICRALFAALRS